MENIYNFIESNRKVLSDYFLPSIVLAVCCSNKLNNVFGSMKLNFIVKRTRKYLFIHLIISALRKSNNKGRESNGSKI